MIPLLLFWLLPTLVPAQTGIPVPQMAHCDQLVLNFLNQYNIPGATLAIARQGKLVYARGFGEASLDGSELTQPHHLFRIASVSKPITGIAIMKLVQDGQLALSDKVFGAGGRLANHPYLSTVSYSDNRLEDITIQHLLEHRAGWNRDVDCISGANPPYPWTINHCDPIGFPLYVTQLYGETNPVREEVLIRFLMEKGLNFAPGTAYAYSNIGYLVLGEVIEAVTGLSYEDYVKTALLAPLGICDMHIGHNLLADKRPREAEYQGNGYTAPSCYGTGQNVPWEYGGWNLEAMDAHGGWIATARDLVRLLSAVDGFATRPDLLSSSTIQTMTTPSGQNVNYAKGWSVNGANNWWHTGALDGTASIWVRSNNGYLWALILNKRIIDGSANAFWAALDGLPWNCVTQTSTWPTHDLFEVPASGSSLSVTAGTLPGTATLSWTAGQGDRRLVVAHAGTPVHRFPLDGTAYQANFNWGLGDDLGDGHYVVYDGTGNQTLISGLDTNGTYHFQVFEYHDRASSSDLPLYQLCEAPAATLDLSGTTAIRDLLAQGIRCYPNPGRDWLQLAWDRPGQVDRVELRTLQGQVVATATPHALAATLPTTRLPAQVYVVSCFRAGAYLGSLKWQKTD